MSIMVRISAHQPSPKRLEYHRLAICLQTKGGWPVQGTPCGTRILAGSRYRPRQNVRAGVPHREPANSARHSMRTLLARRSSGRTSRLPAMPDRGRGLRQDGSRTRGDRLQDWLTHGDEAQAQLIRAGSVAFLMEWVYRHSLRHRLHTNGIGPVRIHLRTRRYLDDPHPLRRRHLTQRSQSVGDAAAEKGTYRPLRQD